MNPLHSQASRGIPGGGENGTVIEVQILAPAATYGPWCSR